MIKRPSYTEEELELMSRDDFDELMECGGSKEIDYEILRNLGEKLLNDELYMRFGRLVLFPKLGKILNEVNSIQDIKTHDFGHHERGVIIGYEINGIIYVVKDFQSREKEILSKAIQTGIYPFFDSCRNTLIEFFAGKDEDLLVNLDCPPEKTGEILAYVCRRIHNTGLTYADDFCSHLFYHPEAEEVKLIDFGISNTDDPREEDLKSARGLIKFKYKNPDRKIALLRFNQDYLHSI